MAERRTGPKEVVLLKRWNDWSRGVGFTIDDGRTPGMSYASGLLGLRGELRVGPFFNEPVMRESLWRDPDGNTVAFAFAGVTLDPVSGGAIVFDATADSGATAGTSLTFSHTMSASANGYLLVGVSTTGGVDPSGVTYNSVAMTKLVSASLSTTVTVSIWGLKAPATGANNVVISIAASQDIVGGSVSFTGAIQTDPAGNDLSSETGTTGSAPSPYMTSPQTADGLSFHFGVSADNEATNTDIGADETSRWQTFQNSAVRGIGSTRVPVSGYQPQYFCEEPATSDSDVPFLYMFRGNVDNDTVRLMKIILSTSSFGVQQGEHEFTTLTQPGQMARYQGKWHFPAAGTTLPRELTTVGTGSVTTDTLTGPTGSGGSANAEHLTNVEFQLAGHRSGSGVRLLIKDGDPQTEASWGSYFGVGDKDEQALGITSVGGATFVLNKEGLYSFNSKGRSRLVFEDFRVWRDVFSRLPMSAYRGGLLLSHPSGLYWWIPGDIPINVGFDGKLGVLANPPSGSTELHGGRFHCTSVAGDFIYAVYQPNLSSITCLLVVGYPETIGSPEKLTWQVIGSINLNNVIYRTQIYVALTARPLVSTQTRPVLWFGDGDGLSYIILDARGSPFRARSDNVRSTAAADAYMSEIIFPEPMDLTEISIYIQDMQDGDEWQLSAFYDDEDTEVNFGTPFIADGKDNRTLDLKKVTRFMLHINWASTYTQERDLPTIKKIELFGRPSSGR